MIHKKISNQEFLTHSSADGLRVTINSTIQLSKYLLEECKFKYVLTFKMNQDRLEVNIKNMFIIYLLTIICFLNLMFTAIFWNGETSHWSK